MFPLTSIGRTVTFWIGLLLVLGLCALCSYVAWSYQGQRKDAEKQTAVNEAWTSAREQVSAEHKLLDRYMELSDRRFGQVLTAIATLKQQSHDRTVAITAEVKQHQPFYQQPLPDTGFALWLSARDAFVRSSSASSSPSSPAAQLGKSSPKSAPAVKQK